MAERLTHSTSPDTTVDATEIPHQRPTVAARRSATATLHEALAGDDIDVTTGPLGRAVVLLAVPMVLELVMESVFALTDVFFVSRLGTVAVATVGLTEAMTTILYAISTGVALATTATVARRVGERRLETAAETTVQAIVVGLLVAVAITVPGTLFAHDLLQLMGGSTELVAGGTGYTRIIMASSTTITLLFVINAAFRGAGDAVLAMRILWLANAINIVLDPCLIFGLGPFPELGLEGAALATAIGRGTGVVAQFCLLVRGHGRLQLQFREVRLRLAIIGALVRISLGGMAQFLIATASWVVLVRIVSTFGSTAVAGYTVAIRIIIFALLPAWGLANAAATLVGQNLGAAQADRAERSVWIAGRYNVAFLLAVSVVFLVFAEHVIGLFTSDPAVLAAGADCLRIISSGYVFYAFGMVLVQAFNGAGDTMTPTVINLACYWLLQIPLAYHLAIHAALGPRGVFLAIVLAESTMSVVAAVLFRRGRWKVRTV